MTKLNSAYKQLQTTVGVFKDYYSTAWKQQEQKGIKPQCVSWKQKVTTTTEALKWATQLSDNLKESNGDVGLGIPIMLVKKAILGRGECKRNLAPVILALQLSWSYTTTPSNRLTEA